MSQVRSAIPGYAGFGDQHARRLSDQQVRAWVGERLAALRERLPADADSAAFDALITHCQFGDQHVIKALEDGRFADPANAAAVETEDDRLLQTATAAETVEAAGVPALIAAIDEAFRHRNSVIVGLKR